MLEQLSGRIHEVLTGVTVSYGQSVVTQVERTRVRFRKLTPNEIAAYVGSGEFQDKAGGYAIQGLASRFVDHIEGSYSNVVGLPIALVDYLLHKIHNEGASESDAFWF
jgi:septum formation protein